MGHDPLGVDGGPYSSAGVKKRGDDLSAARSRILSGPAKMIAALLRAPVRSPDRIARAFPLPVA